MKKYLTFTTSSIFLKLLKKKVENKQKEFNESGYEIESVKYFKNKWSFPTAKCIFFIVGVPCACPCHYEEGVLHIKPCCEDGYIFKYTQSSH